VGVEQLHAQHEVTRGTGGGTPRAGQAGGDTTAQRGARAEMRGFERQHLVVFRQQCFKFDQGRAGARRDHQFGGFVADDTGVLAHVQAGTGAFHAQEILGAAAMDGQGFAACLRKDHTRTKVG